MSTFYYRWKEAKTKTPEDKEICLVYNNLYKEYFCAVYDEETKSFLEKDLFEPLEVTHWREIDAP